MKCKYFLVSTSEKAGIIRSCRSEEERWQSVVSVSRVQLEQITMVGKTIKKAKASKKIAKMIKPQENVSQNNPGFPIIAIGASAGGLEAFEQFFRHMPNNSGMAFVLVSHLDPGHASMLTEILQRTTSMTVVEAQNHVIVLPNRVYVIPPNCNMEIVNGALRLTALKERRGQRMPIDLFMRSLANELGEKAVGVILSGTGTDGTFGLRAVLGAGGVSFVQDPAEAKYDGMPLSAVRSGLATYVLPAEKLPEQIQAYVKTLFEDKKNKPAPPLGIASDNLNNIITLLLSQTGHDFSQYKQSTIRRRVERRMTIHGIVKTETYCRYIKEHPKEAQILFKELLINVTSFFRDPEVFEILKNDMLPKLFEGKPENYVFRVWVVGCSTGEEAYSLAILFREYMDKCRREYKIQIYGTDLDEDAVKTARGGVYPTNIAMDVSQKRLQQFFVKEENGFRVKTEIREMLVFAGQNVIKDPPFTKLDLVSCRNVLIYLEPKIQNRIIQIFHYALKPGGALLLSPSESIGNHSDIFTTVSRKWKLYQTERSIDSTRMVRAAALSWTGGHGGVRVEDTMQKAKTNNFAEVAKRELLQSYAPASVITDEKGNILYVHGDTGKYLRPAPGQASLNIIEMAREGLQFELRTAIHNAASKKRAVVLNDLHFGTQVVKIIVRPITDPAVNMKSLMINFQDPLPCVKIKPARIKQPSMCGESKRVAELKKEILYTRENLQASIEELQASNEEIKSANEELQSTNEELQSTNEELETSKEELQSVNEELVTVNAELHAKIEQITGIQNDLRNLLDNTNNGTIFLDDALSIKRFTYNAADVFRLVSSDVGRPLGDIKSNLEGGVDLVEDARIVLDSLASREKEVRTTGGKFYQARILPYRTLDNVIEGVVLTFSDITELKRVEAAEVTAREYAERVLDAIREPLIVLDNEKKVISAGDSFYRTFRVTPEETIGRSLYELGNRQWNISALRELLDTILPRHAKFENFEVEKEFPGIGHRKMLLNALRIPGKTDEMPLILLAIEDITEILPVADQPHGSKRERKKRKMKIDEKRNKGQAQ